MCTHVFTYDLCSLTRLQGLVVTEIIGPAEFKICIIWPFKKKCSSISYLEKARFLIWLTTLVSCIWSNQGRNKLLAGIWKISRLSIAIIVNLEFNFNRMFRLEESEDS